MKINDLATAAALSDRELLVRLEALARRERESSAELVAHLAALDARPALYAALGFSSLFAYCIATLRLSEDATCSRIEVARACRDYPAILELLASGALTLTSVRLLRSHLTPENHQAVLSRASGCTRREIESLVAELAPRPDVASTVRRLPARHDPAPSIESPAPTTDGALALPFPDSVVPEMTAPPAAEESRAAGSASTPMREHRPIIQATAPERYRVQFAIGPETHARLRRLQALLRREVPSGDPAVIFDRALVLLLEKVEKKKLGGTVRRGSAASIRPGTDRGVPLVTGSSGLTAALRTPIVESRRIPGGVKRAVWRRDGGECAYIGPSGRRCTEPVFVEFHHVQAYARRGEATEANIALRCRRHNQYEAELVFGPRGVAGSSLRP